MKDLLRAFDRMPGGKRCCGGGLTFEQLRLPDGRVPFFPMPPSALAIFRGVELRHATCEHGPLTCRAKGHEAHISFAIQTPRDVLGVLDESRHAIHKSLVEHGALDAHKIWRDAVWLPVTIEEDQEKGTKQVGRRAHSSRRRSRRRLQNSQTERRPPTPPHAASRAPTRNSTGQAQPAAVSGPKSPPARPARPPRRPDVRPSRSARRSGRRAHTCEARGGTHAE
jgi:hypothetical protein